MKRERQTHLTTPDGGAGRRSVSMGRTHTRKTSE